MKNKPIYLKSLAVVFAASMLLSSCKDEPETVQQQAPTPEASGPVMDEVAALQEAEDMLALASEEARVSKDEFSNARRQRFTREENVFLRSAIAVNDLRDPDKANVTLPMFKGIGPDGNDDVYFIVTEAANFYIAKLLGVNFAPKLIFGRDTEGSQEVTISRGRIKFKGAIDFSPVRRLVAGSPNVFPPSVAEPGAIADEEWSSLVVLPSGSVINAQVVANSTGLHDRVLSIDKYRRTVTLQLLNGYQGGDQFYYHLVTDASDTIAATIELGVYAPRLAKLPSFGESNVFDESALLGFSPNVNGETGADNPERQGLNSTIVDDDRDPNNVFPLDPDNDKRFFNNYSPMWDIHLSMWTEEAIAAGERRAIRGFNDLSNLVDEGLVVSFVGSPGAENEFVAGLRNTGAIINCPVIAQPFEKNGDDDDDSSPFGF